MKEPSRTQEMKVNSAHNSPSTQAIRASKVKKSSGGVKKRKIEALHKKFEALIRHRGWTKRQFHHKIGISRQKWYQISWGLIMPEAGEKKRIIDFFDVPEELLWGDKNESNTRV